MKNASLPPKSPFEKKVEPAKQWFQEGIQFCARCTKPSKDDVKNTSVLVGGTSVVLGVFACLVKVACASVLQFIL